MRKNQRLAVLGLLLLLLSTLAIFPPTRPEIERELGAILFASLFLLSFTVLLLEHFFSRPTDVIAAGVSILLLIIPSKPLFTEWGPVYWWLLAYELAAVIIATLALVFLTDEEGPASRRNRVSHFLKELATKSAPGRVQYFALSFFTLLFFVEPRSLPFAALLGYAVFVVAIQPQKWLPTLPGILNYKSPEIGDILGVQGRNTFLVRLHSGRVRPPLRVGDLLEFVYGMDEPPRVRRAILLERFFLEQGQWISVLCHEEIDRQSADLEILSEHRQDAVYKRADRDVGSFLGSLVGVVQDGTDVRTLRFLQAGRAAVSEGDLIQVGLPRGAVLYQVVNGRVDTEALERKNEADFVVGEAVQLGQWNPARGAFEQYGWVPPARTPVTRAQQVQIPEPSADEIQLGLIPGTDFPVLLNKREAVSHHIAILGVTGVGKSVFARNLVKQFSEDDLRVIVVDFTREWAPQMHELGAKPMISDEQARPLRQAIDEIDLETAKFKNQQDQTYIRERKAQLHAGFTAALDDFLTTDEQVRVFELPDLSNTEGVLEYTQWFFKTLFRIARDSGCHGKRVCIVIEEAHTVVPEWNFIGLADNSSKSLVNNISQIALQGRKYGVGFMIIAQRTATVSKTVLTQCNTVIAFQCFDGTSIEFLSHYLPKAVAEALPSLKFRRAVAVGKAIRGSVPLIFDVPEILEAERAL